jgi:hypothetical protein
VLWELDSGQDCLRLARGLPFVNEFHRASKLC